MSAVASRGAPTGLSSLEHDYIHSLVVFVSTEEVPRDAGAGDAASDDDDVGGFGEEVCGAVAQEEVGGFAVPEGF